MSDKRTDAALVEAIAHQHTLREICEKRFQSMTEQYKRAEAAEAELAKLRMERLLARGAALRAGFDGGELESIIDTLRAQRDAALREVAALQMALDAVVDAAKEERA